MGSCILLISNPSSLPYEAGTYIARHKLLLAENNFVHIQFLAKLSQGRIQYRLVNGHTTGPRTTV